MTKILVRMPNWLGDMVMSTAFIHALHDVYPDPEIHVIVKTELAPLADFIPGVYGIHPFSKKEYPGLTGAWRFGKLLRPEKFDLFFSLPDSFSSAVMAWSTRSSKRVGFKKEGRSLLLTDSFVKPASLHRTDEYLSLLEQYTRKPISRRIVALSSPVNEPDSGIVLINFNSEAQSRRMPVEKGISMIKKISRHFSGYRFGFIGSPKEADYISLMIADVGNDPRFISYAGKTDLRELVKLISSAKALITTDSGPAHLANSLGIPTVVLFGAGNEQNTAPYNKENLQVLRAGMLPCEPCVKNKCLLYDVPECMNLINEQQIIQYLSLYLTNAKT